MEGGGWWRGWLVEGVVGGGGGWRRGWLARGVVGGGGGWRRGWLAEGWLAEGVVGGGVVGGGGGWREGVVGGGGGWRRGWLAEGVVGEGWLEEGWLEEGWLEEGWLEEGWLEEGWLEEGWLEEAGMTCWASHGTTMDEPMRQLSLGLLLVAVLAGGAGTGLGAPAVRSSQQSYPCGSARRASLIGLTPTGRVAWRTALPHPQDFGTTPAIVAGGTVYADLSGAVTAVNESNGRIRWSQALGTDVYGSG